MKSINAVMKYYQDETKEIHEFSDALYEDIFGYCFSRISELYTRMKSKVHIITDSELEYIITELPMDLFAVSEKLSSLRLDVEVMKLTNKEKKTTYIKACESKYADTTMSKSDRSEAINRSVSSYMLEYEILYTIYTNLITRVDQEISFARELIMGAKKIWDARRGTENVNPIGEVTSTEDLPEYRREDL